MLRRVRVKKKRCVRALLMAFLLLPLVGFAWGSGTEGDRVVVPILLYHRFGPVVADSMTVKTSVFASQLEYLRVRGYTVIPLRRLVSSLAGKAPPLPDRSIVITVDDGHESVFTDLYPLVRRYHIPVTLFIYPSAISNARYALTWQQLQEMRGSGLVDIQSHTYWHPNFKKEKKRLTAREYEDFVHHQMLKSREVLQEKLGGTVDMLAWPYGIYDGELIEDARRAGYVAGFSMARHPVTRADPMMALPRYLMIDPVQGASFEKLLAESSRFQEKRENPP